MYKLIKPIALTWANQMAYDLSKGKTGKNSLAMKITKTIGEGICYALGQIFKRRQLWLKSHVENMEDNAALFQGERWVLHIMKLVLDLSDDQVS